MKAIVSTQGTSFGFTASVSGSKGHEDGDGTTQLNTHVNAGNKLVISSGGDTNIKGAVASANQVIADIKGNLNLESLQDLAKFDSKSQSISASGTVGIGASVSGSYSQSNMHNDYASVQEQSGIKAGDGGFQIKVGGNTDLKGAVISATQAGKLGSSLTTATLTHSDIANHAISKGSSVGVSGGFSVAGKETEENKNLTNVGGKGGTTAGLPAIVALSENASSTTRSGISGGTLVITDEAAQRAATGKGADEAIAGVNRDVTTGVDSSGKIGNNFDKAALQATMDVTAAFAAAAAKKVGDYAKERMKESAALAKQAEGEPDPVKQAELLQQSKDLADSWKDGGVAKTALHAAIGGLAGGTSGAFGAGASALTTKSISEEIDKLDVPDVVKNLLTFAAGTTVGAIVGGEAGAASAANETANNLLLHKDRKEKFGLSKYLVLDKYKSVMFSPEEMLNAGNDSEVFRQYSVAKGCDYASESCYKNFQSFTKSVPPGEYAFVLSPADDVKTRRQVILAYMGDEAEKSYSGEAKFRSMVDNMSASGGAYHMGKSGAIINAASDNMGQPLYVKSNYSAGKELNNIISNDKDGVFGKVEKVFNWATYTVPDAGKDYSGGKNMFAAALDSMVSNPYSAVVGGFIAYSGGSVENLYYSTRAVSTFTDAVGSLSGIGQKKTVDVAIAPNFQKDGFGVDYYKSQNPLSPVVSRDVYENEFYYRSVAKDTTPLLVRTLSISGTTETSLSPFFDYAKNMKVIF